MSLKKTDLAKNLAKKIDGRMKATQIPQRFAQGAAAVAAKREPAAREAGAKLVPLACRLPPELVQRARQRAMTQEGGIHALMAEALRQWLDAQDNAGSAS